MFSWRANFKEEPLLRENKYTYILIIFVISLLLLFKFSDLLTKQLEAKEVKARCIDKALDDCTPIECEETILIDKVATLKVIGLDEKNYCHYTSQYECESGKICWKKCKFSPEDRINYKKENHRKTGTDGRYLIFSVDERSCLWGDTEINQKP